MRLRIEKKQLGQIKHVNRMTEDRTTRNIYEVRVDGINRSDKPKKTWHEKVKQQAIISRTNGEESNNELKTQNQNLYYTVSHLTLERLTNKSVSRLENIFKGQQETIQRG